MLLLLCQGYNPPLATGLTSVRGVDPPTLHHFPYAILLTPSSAGCGTKVRKLFHNDEWWFSVIDVIGALTGSDRARKYWGDLKAQLIAKEGFSELSEKIGQLPMPGVDGKLYRTDRMDWGWRLTPAGRSALGSRAQAGPPQ
jgi:hypothetical protein